MPVAIAIIASIIGAVAGYFIGTEIGQSMVTEDGFVGDIEALVNSLKGGIIGVAALSSSLAIVGYAIARNYDPNSR